MSEEQKNESPGSEEVKDPVTESNRMYASIAFVVVLIVFGVPLWWKTTEVYRVSLPYSRINNLDQLDMKISTTLFLSLGQIEKKIQLTNYLQTEFLNSKIYSVNFKDLDVNITNNSETLDNGPGTLTIIEVENLETDARLTLFRVLIVSPQITPFKLGQVIREWILTEDSIQSTVTAMSIPSAALHDAAGKRRMPPSKAFDVALSVVVPKPDKIKILFDPKEAIEDYLEPFIEEINVIHNFTLKSQWLYYMNLQFKTRRIPDESSIGRHFALDEDTLPHLITPLEKKLASHISKNPCINLVLYAPPCDESPLHIYSKQGNRVPGALDAFLSPRWGGVVISNPFEACEVKGEDIPEYEPNMELIMGYFLTQLRLLLGIPELKPIEGISMDELSTVTPRKWELDSLIRIRIIEQITSAKLTLKSLAQLLGKISNIVINDEVGASVYDAVKNVELTQSLLESGDLMDALVTSRQAFISAEAAFSDPSLLALLYFPDDQKYAVYIPLFLPVMIPVLLSMRNIWSWLKVPADGQKLKAE